MPRVLLWAYSRLLSVEGKWFRRILKMRCKVFGIVSVFVVQWQPFKRSRNQQSYCSSADSLSLDKKTRPTVLREKSFRRLSRIQTRKSVKLNDRWFFYNRKRALNKLNHSLSFHSSTRKFRSLFWRSRVIISAHTLFQLANISSTSSHKYSKCRLLVELCMHTHTHTHSLSALSLSLEQFKVQVN